MDVIGILFCALRVLRGSLHIPFGIGDVLALMQHTSIQLQQDLLIALFGRHDPRIGRLITPHRIPFE